MLTFPLRTERLDLEPLGTTGRDAFVAYRRDPEVARWQSWTTDYSTHDADRLIAAQPRTVVPGSGEWLQVGVHERTDGTLLGDVAVHALADQPDTYELGVTLSPAAQGNGYAAEALLALGGVLVDRLGAHRLTAQTDARNEPVARLFRRLGFRHEGRAVEADWFGGEWTTVDSWALLGTEWPRV